MTQVQNILKLAETQVGYHEGKSGSSWNNFQKYSPAVPGLEWSQNQSWCATFVSWLALKSGLTDLYPRSANCDASAKWFKDRGRWSEYPAVGAQVYYGKPTDLSHTGIVVNYDATYIYTIEGNTNTSGSAQGDGVYKQKRLRKGTNVIGYGYPKFRLGIKTADPDKKWRKSPLPKPTVPVVDKPATPPPVTAPGNTPVPPGDEVTFGLDASHYQFDAGFSLAGLKKQNYDFVIFKATQGIGWVDDTYAKALASAKSLGLLVGVYHFLEHGNGAKQAQNLAAHIIDKTLPVYIDVEPIPGSKPTAADWISFRRAATSLGLNVKGKYLTSSYWQTIGSPSLVGPLVLWRAAYPSSKHAYGSALYPGNKHERWNSFGGQTPVLWQFASSGMIDGYNGNLDLNAYRGTLAQLKASGLFKDYSAVTPLPKPTPKPTPVPVPAVASLDFRIHLVPGNKVETPKQVKADMALVLKKTFGGSAVVFNTERETALLRTAVSDGLGTGWTRALENENAIAYGSSWTPAGDPSALLLAKEDPGMAGVSPYRYLDRVPAANAALKDVVIAMKGTHLLSEANCKHVNVKARAWREKMWPIQVNDVIDACEVDYKAGVPQVLVGDFNTGIYFTGSDLFKLLQNRFGANVTHVHNGNLDHIFLISTDKVKLSEVGFEFTTDNASDHDMVTARIRAEVR